MTKLSYRGKASNHPPNSKQQFKFSIQVLKLYKGEIENLDSKTGFVHIETLDIRRRFFKILWSSHNILTLLKFTYSEKATIIWRNLHTPFDATK